MLTAKFELIDGTKVTLAGNDGEAIADATWDIIQSDRKRHQEKDMTDQDLPEGYRWATAAETERYTARPTSVPGAIVVKRTMDSQGVPYTQDEADLAVPKRRQR